MSLHSPATQRAESFMSDPQRVLEFLTKILIGISAFVPLIVGNYLMPTLAPKVFLFQNTVLLMAGVYVVLFLFWRQRYKVSATPITIAIFFFGLSLGISTLMGVDWYRSLWGSQIRMTGVFLVFHYILYYVIVSSVIRKWEDWQWLLRTFLLAGSLVMFIGLVEAGNPSAFCHAGSLRVSSTIGNPTFFGAYGMFLIFLGSLAFLKEKNARWLPFIVLSIVLGLAGMFASGTRSALVGFLVGGGFVFLCYLWHFKGQKKEKKILAPIFLLALTLLLPLLSWFTLCQISSVEEIPVAGRLVGASSTDSLHTRLIVWESAADAWREKPVFGWGPNNFHYAFSAYYPPKILQYGISETWFDVAHSVPFDMLATQGLVGLLSYLGLFGAAGFVLQRSYKKKRIDIHVFSIGGGFLIAHFIHNLFLFETPTSYLYFFFFLAFLNSQTPQSSNRGANQKQSKKKLLSYGIIVTILMLFFLVLYNIPAVANQLMLQAQQRFSPSPREAVELYQKAVTIPSPYGRDFRLSFFDQGISLFSARIARGEKDAAEEFFFLGREELQKNRELHPLDVRVHRIQANLYRMGFQLFSDSSFLREAESVLEDALTKSPQRQELQYIQAMVKFELQEPKEALTLLQGTFSHDPGIRKGWMRLICRYEKEGTNEMIKKTIIAQWLENKTSFTSSEISIMNVILQPECSPS